MTETVWTIKSTLDWTVGYLERKGDENPLLSAQWLLCNATGLSRIELYTNFDKPLTMEERDVLRVAVSRRGAGEPLQYITGEVGFRYITVEVEPGVLIPRPETEVLVSEALAELNLPRVADRVESSDDGTDCIVEPDLPAIDVLDMCTGTGCIACSIAHEYPAAHVLATDIAPEALALAQKNANLLGLDERIEVIESDLFDAISASSQDRFDLIVSNPPYIPTAILAGLDREVVDFEPTLALDGGEDGLDLFRRMITPALQCLKPGGVLAVELHEDCLDQACQLVCEAGFDQARIVKDLAGRDRILIAHRPQ